MVGNATAAPDLRWQSPLADAGLYAFILASIALEIVRYRFMREAVLDDGRRSLRPLGHADAYVGWWPELV